MPTDTIHEFGPRPLCVLLVEDNAHVARALCHGLVADGFDCEIASSIRAAREACSRRTFDALLLDLTLPNGDGMMVVDQVVPLAPGIPFLIVTAHHDDALAVTAITRGADDVLYKGTPNLRADLTRRLRYAVFRHQRQRGTVLAVDAEQEQRLYQRRAADRREDRNNRLGWFFYWLAAGVLGANIVADLAVRQRPSFSLTTALMTFFFATLAVALTQGVKVNPNKVLEQVLRRHGDPPV